MVLNNGLSCLEIWGDLIVGGNAQILTALSNCGKVRNFVKNQSLSGHTPQVAINGLLEWNA